MGYHHRRCSTVVNEINVPNRRFNNFMLPFGVIIVSSNNSITIKTKNLEELSPPKIALGMSCMVIMDLVNQQKEEINH